MRHIIFAATLVLCAGLFAAPASALSWDEGEWQLEFAGGGALEDRSGDIFVSLNVDREMPMSPRTTLSLRLLPLFVYTQDDYDDDDDHRFWRHWHRDNDNDDDTLIGAGVGFGIRIYPKKDVYEGFYFEAGLTAIPHFGRLAEGSSNIDFLSTGGVGYKFNDRWHAILKIEHISNAGLGDENAGTNIVRLGVGYSF